MSNSHHLHHHLSGFTAISSLLDHCNILLADLLFSFQPSHPLRIYIIQKYIRSPLCSKPSSKSPLYVAWNPKPTPSLQGSPGWTWRLSDLGSCSPLPLFLLSLTACHATHTPHSKSWLLLFPLPAPFLCLLSTWLTMIVGILKTKPVGCLQVEKEMYYKELAPMFMEADES